MVIKLFRAALTFTLFMALFVQSGIQAQDVSGAADIRARGRARKLVLTARGKTHQLEVGENIGAAKLDDVTVLFATRRANATYLLVDACGPSKLKSDNRQCGAGQECNLLWIKLNNDWRMDEIKSVLYESCWLTVTSTDGYTIKGQRLLLEYSDFSKKIVYQLTYDADLPESGFRVQGSTIKDDG